MVKGGRLMSCASTVVQRSTCLPHLPIVPTLLAVAALAPLSRAPTAEILRGLLPLRGEEDLLLLLLQGEEGHLVLLFLGQGDLLLLLLGEEDLLLLLLQGTGGLLLLQGEGDCLLSLSRRRRYRVAARNNSND